MKGGQLKRKPNYTLKAKVISNGCCKALSHYHLSIFKLHQLAKDEANLEKIEKCENYIDRYNEELKNYSAEEIEEAERVNYASYKRTKRLNDRIMYLLQFENALFLTLTFTDSVLNSTSEQTRREYVRKFLKTQCKYYVANIDYGKEKGREHYHAVVVPNSDMVDGKPYRDKIGNIDFKRVWFKSNENDFVNSSKRLAKYVNKLTNHAIKQTTKQNRVIYSKMSYE